MTKIQINDIKRLYKQKGLNSTNAIKINWKLQKKNLLVHFKLRVLLSSLLFPPHKNAGQQ